MERYPDRNVVGGELLPCSAEPVTGFYRDGCCATGPEDVGSHTVCAVMTEEFLAFSHEGGERPLDTASRVGLSRPAVRRSLVRLRLALAGGVRGRRFVAPVVLGATHERALEAVPIEALTSEVAVP